MSLAVFVSHSVGTTELPIVHHLSAALTGAGIQPYLALYDRQPGNYLSAKVQASISHSDVLLVLVTNSGIESKWVHEEIGFALGKGLRVVPFVEKGTDASAMLEGREYVEFDPGAAATGVDQMASYFKWLKTQKDLAEAQLAVADAEKRAADAELFSALVLIGALIIIAILLARE